MKFPFFRSKPSEKVRTGGELRQHVVKPGHADIVRNAPRRKIRMYDAGTTNRLNEDFPISISSANAEILTSVHAARSRARRLERDNPYAKNIINTFCNNVVGDDPFRLEMKVGKKDATGAFVDETETNNLIEEAWKDAGLPENCTVRRDVSRLELYLQVEAAAIRDGGIVLRHYRAFPKNKFNYAIEPIEIDRLDHNWNRPAVGTANEIQFSIEMDEWHGPLAYHLLTRHPGDVFAWSNTAKFRERVEARDIIHFCELRSRAGQYVGMPVFSSVIQRLHRIDQYDIAEMTAAIVAACKMGFFTKGDTTDEYVPDESNEMGRTMKAEAGAFEELPEGYDFKQYDPNHPVEAYANFTQQNLRAVAAGSGIAYHTMTGDLASVNFSSGRLGEIAQRDEFKKRQKHMVLSCVRPHFAAWLKNALLTGAIPLPISRYEEFLKAANFHGKRWPYVNPLQDAQADALRVDYGFDSRDRIISESDRGGDVETVNQEIASGKKSDEAHKLDFSNANGKNPPIESNPDDTGADLTKIKGRNGFHRNGDLHEV